MGSLSIVVFVSVLAVSLVGLGETAYSAEVDAKVFVKHASSKIYDAYNKFGDNLHKIKNVEDSKDIFSILLNQGLDITKLAVISELARMYDTSNFKDEELKLALRNLRKSLTFFIFTLSFAIMDPEQANEKNIEPFQNGLHESGDDKLAYNPDLRKVFAESNDPEELRYYLEAWRQESILLAPSMLKAIMSLYEMASKSLDKPAIEIWSKYYDDDWNFLIEMENVMKEIKPLYQQLHAFIRTQLSQKYGANIVNGTGLIPDHLFQQVLVQAWTNSSLIENGFPANQRQMPPVDEFLKEKNFDGRKLLEIAENFYTSLGLEPMGEDFWNNQAKMYDADDQNNGSYCSPTIFDQTPKVYLQYCEQVGFRNLILAHGHLSRMHYAKAKQHLPAYFFRSYDLEYAVGEAVQLSVSTPKHLSAFGMTSNDYRFTDDLQMNRLLRMAVHTVLNVPVFFVETKIITDYLNGAVDMDNITEHYWTLMESYAGVARPSDPKFTFRFFSDWEENLAVRKFVSDVLGYQFYRALCKKSGQTGELHNCDFYNSTEAGDALKEMMSLGSSKPWRQVVGKLLPENPALSADGLLEYYAPLQSWLEKKNKESNAEIGWKVSSQFPERF